MLKRVVGFVALRQPLGTENHSMRYYTSVLMLLILNIARFRMQVASQFLWNSEVEEEGESYSH